MIYLEFNIFLKFADKNFVVCCLVVKELRLRLDGPSIDLFEKDMLISLHRLACFILGCPKAMFLMF